MTDNADEPSLDRLSVARYLAALAQDGLHYSREHYDRDRFARLRALASRLLAEDSALSPRSAEAVLAAETGHATAKVDVRGWVGDERGRVLLVREAVDGRWALPGGWAEPHSTPSAAIAREVREEAGRGVVVSRLLACFDRDLQAGADPLPHRVFKLFFHCDDHGAADPGGGAAAQETTAVDWFDPLDPPPLSLGRNTPDQLRRLAAVVADPQAPALFD
ncbi:MAG: NUDIX hydrolase N-terminal domain-containing protein [Egibacteraceae bacterium]